MHLSGGRRRASLGICPGCHAAVLVGLDADRMAFTVAVDIAPLNRDGEIAAIINNRNTFDLINSELHKRGNSQFRKEWRIRPAIVAEHKCGITTPAELRNSELLPPPIPEDPPW